MTPVTKKYLAQRGFTFRHGKWLIKPISPEREPERNVRSGVPSGSQSGAADVQKVAS